MAPDVFCMAGSAYLERTSASIELRETRQKVGFVVVLLSSRRTREGLTCKVLLSAPHSGSHFAR